MVFLYFFFSSRRRHTRFDCDWSSDVCSSDLVGREHALQLDPKGGSGVAPGGVEEGGALERRAEQAVELGEADADIAPGRAEPEAEARSLILLFAGKVRGNRTPPSQGLPPRHLRPHRLQ